LPRGSREEVQILAGEPNASAARIFTGEVVGIEPVTDHEGRTHARVLARNRLHRLTGEPKTRTFVEQSDAEIVAAIAREHGLIPAPSGDVHLRYAEVPQGNQTDLEFLLARAARLAYEVFVDDTTLFFRKPEDAPPLVLARKGGGDARLRLFLPRLSSTVTVQTVVVNGIDPSTGAEVRGAAAAPTIPIGSGVSDEPFGRKVVVAADVGSIAEADALAKAMLGAIAAGRISAEALSRGTAALRAGALVVIQGQGGAFDGEYFVQGASHRMASVRVRALPGRMKSRELSKRGVGSWSRGCSATSSGADGGPPAKPRSASLPRKLKSNFIFT